MLDAFRWMLFAENPLEKMSVGPESLIKEVDQFVGEDQRLLGLLNGLCEKEVDILGRPVLEGLADLLQEKEALQESIESRAEASQALWKRVEEASLSENQVGRMDEALESVRVQIAQIQEFEQIIAKRLKDRKDEAQLMLGHISQKGKALSAYRPNLKYSPRFVDKRE